MDSVEITNPKALTSIYASKVNVTMKGLNMHDIGTTSKSSVYGAALQCSDCSYITVTSSTFTNMYSQEGGIFYITETNDNHLSTNTKGKYTITGSTFEYGIANAGGAIYLNNPQYITISSTSFISN